MLAGIESVSRTGFAPAVDVDDEKVRGVLRIGVLIDELACRRATTAARCWCRARSVIIAIVACAGSPSIVATPSCARRRDCSASLASKAIRVPSGDHVGRHASNCPLVICTGCRRRRRA